jgi:hypothetical protein
MGLARFMKLDIKCPPRVALTGSFQRQAALPKRSCFACGRRILGRPASERHPDPANAAFFPAEVKRDADVFRFAYTDARRSILTKRRCQRHSGRSRRLLGSRRARPGVAIR